ncbi:MAG: hypothetical protein MAG458_01327 [Nitrosopumilus sp.]|nr:hypothetical protein [Nitrosopumilus sp.]
MKNMSIEELEKFLKLCMNTADKSKSQLYATKKQLDSLNPDNPIYAQLVRKSERAEIRLDKILGVIDGLNRITENMKERSITMKDFSPEEKENIRKNLQLFRDLVVELQQD